MSFSLAADCGDNSSNDHSYCVSYWRGQRTGARDRYQSGTETPGMLADVNGGAGQALADELGGRFIQAHLSWRSDCRQLIDETIRQLGGLDILINNAGFQHLD